MSRRSRIFMSLVACSALAAATVAAPATAGAATGSDDTGGAEPPAELVDEFGVDALSEPQITEQRSLFGGARESTIRIGPVIAEAHEHDDDDHDGGHEAGSGHGTHGDGPRGPEEKAHGTHTTIAAPVPMPCWLLSCYITSVEPDLTYKDGSRANYDTDIMLHHAVLFDRSREDITCADETLGLAGQRIFAAGNERTGGQIPEGYGLPIGPVPLLWSVVELENFAPEAQAVFFDMTVEATPSLLDSGVTEVTPVWWDVANCTFDSHHHVPEGESTTTWQWESTLTGTLHAAGGHLHDGGDTLTLHNRTTGDELCASHADYGNDPAYLGHIDTMTTCTDGNLGTITQGDTLELVSDYHSHYPQHNAMSIMIGFVEETD
ncbi:hypothetical protein [Haloechinothrix sp. LS1_15]|uniref:hypothetical protein n=1 Tax=Haloechinothrix sp. LS1_15 TaxID=2652248 RepID=UPI00294525B7|nr:hypothetical protein [Haloechinothrix sp. LS1_15]MDV6013811.1 hypothetical protein [Haloechinothrix sp. LS1_15]